MRVALVLLGYASLLGTAVPWLLRRAGWVDRAPRLAIVAWQAVSAGFVVSLVLAGLALAVPVSRISADLAELLQACVMAVRAQYATPGGAVVGAAGIVLAVGGSGRAVYGLVRIVRTAHKDRAAHREVLALLGRPDARTGAVVLDHERAVAYCLPGRGGRIVLTTAAVRALGGAELRAVLAHERAHLRARHDLAIAAATGLARAFPGVPVLRIAAEEIARLAELAADDAACRAAGRLTLAEALLAVAAGDTPAAALGAAGTHTCERIRRLLRPHARLGMVRAALVAALAVGALALPVSVAAQPALAARTTTYCPVETPRQPMPWATSTKCLSCLSMMRLMSEDGPDRLRVPWRVVIVVIVVGALAWGIVLWRGPGLGGDATSASGSSEEISIGLTRYAADQRRQVPDVRGTTLDGDKLALADLRGQVVVVNIWGSWCVPCREEAPDLARAARETASRGVRFVGIDVRDTPSAARAFVRKFDIPYPSLVDSDGSLLLAFDGIVPVSAVPTTVVIDPDGRIAARVIGKTTYSTLLGLIEHTLDE